MPAIDLPFSRQEYDRRLTKTRAAMQALDLDILFVTDPSNQAWLTGYDGWSFYVHQGVILPQEGDPIWWGRRMDSFGARRTVWMQESEITGYDDSYVQSTTRHPMQDLAQHLLALADRQGLPARASGSRWKTTITQPRPMPF